MATAVFCITKTVDQASIIINRLKASGFSDGDISVLLPDKSGQRDLGHVKQTKAPEGAATGMGTGGVIGGTLGLLAGIGALAIPGVGPFIAAGPIMAALSGAAVGAAAGGIVGTLIGMGIPEYVAKQYEGKIHSGNVLLSVHCHNGDETKRAKQIMDDAGAEDISSSGEASADVKVNSPANRQTI